MVIPYGPFLMNDKEEIQHAFDDYHATKFGLGPETATTRCLTVPKDDSRDMQTEGLNGGV